MSPEFELIVQLGSLHSKIQKCIGDPLSAHGISLTESLVLLHLQQARDNKLRRIDLAQKVGLSASGVTRLLNPMQKIGLIEKEESVRDARVSLVALSRAGAKIFREAEKTFEHSARSLLAPLSGKDRGALSRIVNALLSSGESKQ
jgi:DNA-binding MarR family transcriptional regulator